MYTRLVPEMAPKNKLGKCTSDKVVYFLNSQFNLDSNSNKQL